MCPHLTSLTSYINSSGTSDHVNDVKKQLVSSLTSKLSFRDTREHADHFFLIAINILLQNEEGGAYEPLLFMDCSKTLPS